MLPNNQQLYYLVGLSQLVCPRRRQRLRALKQAWCDMSEQVKQRIHERVGYYNRLNADFTLDSAVKPYSMLRLKNHGSRYYLDMMDALSLFDPSTRVDYVFGDVTSVPDTPKLLKSRPICDHNHHSVLMPFNRLRHFKVVKDTLPFASKKDACVWRGVARQQHRIDFLARFYGVDVPLDAGCTDHKAQDKTYYKPFMSVHEQLQYKYILSIEGYDVATNLKWIMNSNSLCFMRKPRFETWYQEGTLRAGVEYVELRDDYADLPDKISYFNANPAEAEAIISRASAYFNRFMNPIEEAIVAFKVVQGYLMKSGQLGEPIL